MENEKLIAGICSATGEVFSMMLGIELQNGESHQETADDESFDGVVGLIGLAGAWVGAGRLSCSAEFAMQVSTALLATPYESVNAEVLDAMAEVTNMIFGNVKTNIEEEYGAMGLSIPTVIYGRNYKARSVSSSGWTVVPFFCGKERMDVKICLAPGSGAFARAEQIVHQALRP